MEHYKPRCFSDRIARLFTKSMRFFADTFFQKRYGHRAVVLETVAGVPDLPPACRTQLMISLSQQSSANATRTRSPLSHDSSNPSEHLARWKTECCPEKKKALNKSVLFRVAPRPAFIYSPATRINTRNWKKVGQKLAIASPK